MRTTQRSGFRVQGAGFRLGAAWVARMQPPLPSHAGRLCGALPQRSPPCERSPAQLPRRYVVEARVLAKPSIFQRVCYSATWMPFPFPHIDICIASQGYDLGEVRPKPNLDPGTCPVSSARMCLCAPGAASLHTVMTLVHAWPVRGR